MAELTPSDQRLECIPAEWGAHPPHTALSLPPLLTRQLPQYCSFGRPTRRRRRLPSGGRDSAAHGADGWHCCGTLGAPPFPCSTHMQM